MVSPLKRLAFLAVILMVAGGVMVLAAIGIASGYEQPRVQEEIARGQPW